jgi:hypothetical protein
MHDYLQNELKNWQHLTSTPADPVVVFPNILSVLLCLIHKNILTLLNHSSASFNNNAHSNLESIRFITSIQNSSLLHIKSSRNCNSSLVSLSAGAA